MLPAVCFGPILAKGRTDVAEGIGSVIVNHGTRVLIETGDGKVLRCSVRGKRMRPVCGDLVEWETADADTGVVKRIVERRNALERADGRGGTAAVASALDRVLVVVAHEPKPDLVLADRYLVMCERAGIEAAILVNKIDAAPGGFAAQFAGYALAGYPVWQCSALAATGLAALREALAGRVTLLAGQSGAGKSSLLNALIPDLDVQVGLLSAASGEGRHTTTTTMRYELPGGGALVDSPGVREFWLPEMPAPELIRGFREIARAGERCRFRDCAHASEPDCAVRGAVERGEIAPRRYQCYRALLRALC